jgi:hypothetical protein
VFLFYDFDDDDDDTDCICDNVDGDRDDYSVFYDDIE